MQINVENQKEELKKINNQMTLLMKKKKAIQEYLKQENDKIIGINSIEEKIMDLYEDREFIKKNGRKRYYWEIGNIVGYSSRSIQRFFDNQKKTR